jgi:hypothetical protein
MHIQLVTNQSIPLLGYRETKKTFLRRTQGHADRKALR